MDFVTATQLIKDGHRIQRESWNREVYISMYQGWLSIHQDDKLHHPWLITESDLYAYDWKSVTDG
jgi:hypothetical protein